MSDLHDFAGSVASFYDKTAVEQLLIIAWFLEVRRQHPYFDAAYMRQCFKQAGLDAPDLSVYLPRLAAKKPPQLRKERDGYCLASNMRREFDRKYGGEPTTIAISRLLENLPNKFPDIAEQAYLAEALSCYRVKAYRAAIIMAWNLAYNHLVRWVVEDAKRLAAFNSGLSTRYPKTKIILAKEEDCAELKEAEFVEVCRTVGLINKNTAQILRDKLARRNSVAHPSRIVVSQHQADDAISDLVNNVIIPLT